MVALLLTSTTTFPFNRLAGMLGEKSLGTATITRSAAAALERSDISTPLGIRDLRMEVFMILPRMYVQGKLFSDQSQSVCFYRVEVGLQT